MIGWRDPDGRPRRGVTVLSATRWALATVAVVIAHGAGAWVAVNWHPVETMPNDPPPAIQIDLAPLAVAPEAPPEELAPGQLMSEAQPLPTPDTQTPVEDTSDPTPPVPVETQEPVKPDPDPTPAQEAQTEEVKPEVVQPVTPPDVPVPVLPEKDKAEAVLAPPPPKPKAHKRPPPKKHEAERKKPIDPDKPKQKQTSAPPNTLAQRSDQAAAPAAGSASSPSVSPATWTSQLNAYLNRFKRPVPGGGAGTAFVAFTISRSGQVLSVRLVTSSGDAALDADAVALPKRASPVPAPPPTLGGRSSILLTVPIRLGH